MNHVLVDADQEGVSEGKGVRMACLNPLAEVDQDEASLKEPWETARRVKRKCLPTCAIEKGVEPCR